MPANLRTVECGTCHRTIGTYMPTQPPRVEVLRAHSPSGRRGDPDVCEGSTSRPVDPARAVDR